MQNQPRCFTFLIWTLIFFDVVHSSSVEAHPEEAACGHGSASVHLMVLGKVSSDSTCAKIEPFQNFTLQLQESSSILCEKIITSDSNGEIKEILKINYDPSFENINHPKVSVKLCDWEIQCVSKVVEIKHSKSHPNQKARKIETSTDIKPKNKAMYKLKLDLCFNYPNQTTPATTETKNLALEPARDQKEQKDSQSRDHDSAQHVLTKRSGNKIGNPLVMRYSRPSRDSDDLSELEDSFGDLSQRLKRRDTDNVENQQTSTRLKREAERRNWNDIGGHWKPYDGEKRNWDDVGMGWMKRNGEKKSWEDLGVGWMKDEEKRNWDDVGMGWMKRNGKRSWEDLGMGWMKDREKKSWEDLGMGWMKDEEKRNWDDVGMGWMKRNRAKRSWDDLRMGWMKDREKKNWEDLGIGWMKDEKKKSWDDLGVGWMKDKEKRN